MRLSIGISKFAEKFFQKDFGLLEQALGVSAVKYIFFMRNDFAKLLELIPNYRAAVKLVGVTPNVIKLRLVGFKREEFLAELEHFVRLAPMHRGIKSYQVEIGRAHV